MTLPELPSDTINTSVFCDDNLDFHLFDGDWVTDIYDMHTKFGVREVIENLDREKLLKFVEFRLDFLQEELDEARLALNQLYDLQQLDIGAEARDEAVIKAGDDIVDAMIDLCVVSIGTLDALNVDAYEAWDRVLGANMAKEPGVKPGRPNPLGLPDLIKPEGWVAPSHSDNIGLLGKL
jgi:predicted HAD superfamily Cof-like phosphohydrolase